MLQVLVDDLGFHHPAVELSHEARNAIIRDWNRGGQNLEELYRLLLVVFSNQEKLYEGIHSMTNAESAAIAALTTAVQQNSDIAQQAVSFLGTIEGQLATVTAELAAAGTTVDNSPALAALTSTVNGATQALATAFQSVGTPVTVPPVDGGSVTPPATDGTDNGGTPATGDDASAPTS